MGALPTRKSAGYGWRPDRPDFRDLRSDTLGVPNDKLGAALPAKFSLRTADGYPATYDQAQLGSCTGNGEAFQFEWAMHRAVQVGWSKETPFTPSRLWIYYQERVTEGTVDQDAGAEPRDGFVAMTNLGVPPEDDWPYDISTFAGPVPAKAQTDAGKDKALVYVRRSQSPQPIKSSVYHHAPVGFGFTVYESFESPDVAKTGMVPMPAPDEQVLGGHYTVIVGWDEDRQLFEVRNSWGDGWGDKGHFWVPYAYVLDPNLAGDNWALVRVS